MIVHHVSWKKSPPVNVSRKDHSLTFSRGREEIQNVTSFRVLR